MKKIYRILLIVILAFFVCQNTFAAQETTSDTVKLIIKQNAENVNENTIPKDETAEELAEEAIEEDEKVIDNTDTEFSSIEDLDQTDKEEIELSVSKDESLFEKLYKLEIDRTDVPSYLMKDKLTFSFEHGPIEKMQVYGAYHSTFNNNFDGPDYDLNYTNEYIQFGLIGKTRDKYTDFQGLFNIMPHRTRNFVQDFIADAYFINTRIPHHKILLGVSRNQIGVEGGMGAFTLPFVMRSQISRNFGSTRALGIRLVGDYSLLDYSLAFNSSDRYFKAFYPGVEFTGWVNFKPLGKTDGRYGSLVLGGGLNTGRNNYNYTVAGAYVGYKYKRLMANFEYAIADGYNGHYVSTDKATGFYTTLAYKVTPKLQVLARADHFDPNRDIKHNSKDEYTIGINYFLKGQALKLILNYVFCNNQNGPASNRLIVGTQILI